METITNTGPLQPSNGHVTGLAEQVVHEPPNNNQSGQPPDLRLLAFKAVRPFPLKCYEGSNLEKALPDNSKTWGGHISDEMHQAAVLISYSIKLLDTTKKEWADKLQPFIDRRDAAQRAYRLAEEIAIEKLAEVLLLFSITDTELPKLLGIQPVSVERAAIAAGIKVIKQWQAPNPLLALSSKGISGTIFIISLAVLAALKGIDPLHNPKAFAGLAVIGILIWLGWTIGIKNVFVRSTAAAVDQDKRAGVEAKIKAYAILTFAMLGVSLVDANGIMNAAKHSFQGAAAAAWIVWMMAATISGASLLLSMSEGQMTTLDQANKTVITVKAEEILEQRSKDAREDADMIAAREAYGKAMAADRNLKLREEELKAIQAEAKTDIDRVEACYAAQVEIFNTGYEELHAFTAPRIGGRA